MARKIEVIDFRQRTKTAFFRLTLMHKIEQAQCQLKGLCARGQNILRDVILRIGFGPLLDQLEQQKDLSRFGNGIGNTLLRQVVFQKVFVNITDRADFREDDGWCFGACRKFILQQAGSAAGWNENGPLHQWRLGFTGIQWKTIAHGFRQHIKKIIFRGHGPEGQWHSLTCVSEILPLRQWPEPCQRATNGLHGQGQKADFAQWRDPRGHSWRMHLRAHP